MVPHNVNLDWRRQKYNLASESRRVPSRRHRMITLCALRKKGYDLVKHVIAQFSQRAVPSKPGMLAHGQSKMATPNAGTNIRMPIINPGLIGDEGYGGFRLGRDKKSYC